MNKLGYAKQFSHICRKKEYGYLYEVMKKIVDKISLIEIEDFNELVYYGLLPQ